MRVAALQFDIRRDDVAANLAAVEAGLTEAAAAGVELICLPEMWPTSFGAVPADAAAWRATEGALARVAELSEQLDLAVVGSAFGQTEGAELPTNRLHVFDRGELRAAYDKVHLFSPTAERESFSAGSAPPPVIEVRGAKLTGIVCYDLRFPELLRTAFRSGADLACIPAQWPSPRSTHWRALVVGRAVEFQGFVLAVNRTGRDVVGRRELDLEFPGNSLCCDPHGVVVAEGRGTSGLVVADIELDRARRLRTRVPVAKDERRELYRRWDEPDS